MSGTVVVHEEWHRDALVGWRLVKRWYLDVDGVEQLLPIPQRTSIEGPIGWRAG